MKHLIILSILLISCIAGGCIGSENMASIEGDDTKTEFMTCYDKAIVASGTGNVRYIIVFVDRDGGVYQATRWDDPSFYSSVEIGGTYEIELKQNRDYAHDIIVSKIVECDQAEEL